MKNYTIAKQRYTQIKKRNYNYLFELFIYENRFIDDIEVLKSKIEKNFIEFTKLENINLETINEYNSHLQNAKDTELKRVNDKFIKLELKKGQIGFKDFNNLTKKYINEKNEKFDLHFLNEQIFLEDIYFSDEESYKRKCGYCGVSEEQNHILINNDKINTKRITTRGKTLEIDRIKPHETYNKDNILLSCYWCNNAKSDEFSLEEFKLIALGINKVFNQRLQKISKHYSEIIKFPDYDKYKKIDY